MKILLNEQQLEEGIGRLAGEIRARYVGKPLTIVGVLIGSVVLVADLIRRLDIPLKIDLVQARSYRARAPGPLVLNTDLLANVHGRDVLLVDDIFDTGHTLQELIPELDDLGPNTIRTAVLLRKQGQSQVSFAPDFVGFDVPNVFVVGFGLDYRDQYRNLPYVAALEEKEMSEEPLR